jgi:hypothetical protein
MPCALSRNARTFMVRCLSGEAIEVTERTMAARRELESAGLLKRRSAEPTQAALRRRDEFLPHNRADAGGIAPPR